MWIYRKIKLLRREILSCLFSDVISAHFNIDNKIIFLDKIKDYLSLKNMILAGCLIFS